jgi:hypothetical protein
MTSLMDLIEMPVAWLWVDHENKTIDHCQIYPTDPAPTDNRWTSYGPATVATMVDLILLEGLLFRQGYRRYHDATTVDHTKTIW